MAFRFDHSDEFGDMADINVTPLVDVMLVLLVIFMVTAPMLTQGLTVALPSAEGKSFELASNNPSKIQVTATGAVYLDGTPVGSSSLEKTLGPMLRARRVRRALLEADGAPNPKDPRPARRLRPLQQEARRRAACSPRADNAGSRNAATTSHCNRPRRRQPQRHHRRHVRRHWAGGRRLPLYPLHR